MPYRLAVARMHAMQCSYCSRESSDLHQDHVVPRSRGGPDNASNIVMACQPCNSSKTDMLASEWLGDECPARILAIEQRVCERLENKIKSRRDWKAKAAKANDGSSPGRQTIYISTTDGNYCGEVIEEHETVFRVELTDAFFLVGCNKWTLSGEIRDIAKLDCKMFSDATACWQYASTKLRVALGDNARREPGEEQKAFNKAREVARQTPPKPPSREVAIQLLQLMDLSGCEHPHLRRQYQSIIDAELPSPSQSVPPIT